MAASSHLDGHGSPHIASTSVFSSKAAHWFISIFAKLGGTVTDKANSTLKALQVGRMISTFSHMSDYQLAQIGIQRSDIPEYAKTLMVNELTTD